MSTTDKERVKEVLIVLGLVLVVNRALVGRWVVRGIVVFLLLAVASPAQADRAAAKVAYDHAVKQYNLGEYQAALDGFTQAYNELPEPVLLFNLAQCQRQLGNKQKAVTLYKSYLRETDGAAPNISEVRRITNLLEQDLLREQTTRQNPPTGVTPPLNNPTPPVVVTPIPEPAKPVTTDAGMPTLRKAGIGVAAAGVVLAVVGIGLAASAPGVASDADHASSLSDAHDQYNRAGNFSAAGWALIGVGAAAAVVGAVMCALPRRHERVNAMIGRARVGVLVTW